MKNKAIKEGVYFSLREGVTVEELEDISLSSGTINWLFNNRKRLKVSQDYKAGNFRVYFYGPRDDPRYFLKLQMCNFDEVSPPVLPGHRFTKMFQLK